MSVLSSGATQGVAAEGPRGRKGGGWENVIPCRPRLLQEPCKALICVVPLLSDDSQTAETRRPVHLRQWQAVVSVNPSSRGKRRLDWSGLHAPEPAHESPEGTGNAPVLAKPPKRLIRNGGGEGLRNLLTGAHYPLHPTDRCSARGLSRREACTPRRLYTGIGTDPDKHHCTSMDGPKRSVPEGWNRGSAVA